MHDLQSASQLLTRDTIGFDVAINDDNLNGTRDGQSILYGTSNNYQDTSQFGELVLTP